MLKAAWGNLLPASHPVRGAWIEMYLITVIGSLPACRTPSGVRGLKWLYTPEVGIYLPSHPVRGAWIEIEQC